MEITTIIAYGITFLAVFFAITGVPQALIGGLVGKALGAMLGILIGAIVTWACIDLAWLHFEGNHIPIAALAGSIVFIFLHGLISRNELTHHSNLMMAGEAWALILVGAAQFFIQDNVRWY